MASLLLGMLMTVLTMVFNQSSISWRVGQASITDMDDVTQGISSVHDVADNLYIWENTAYLLTSVWEERPGHNNALRQNRPFAAEDGSTGVAGKPSKITDEASDAFFTKFTYIGNEIIPIQDKPQGNPASRGGVSVDSGKKGDPAKMYTVNVKSAGPNKTFGDYDDIWSFPNDFNL